MGQIYILYILQIYVAGARAQVLNHRGSAGPRLGVSSPRVASRGPSIPKNFRAEKPKGEAAPKPSPAGLWVNGGLLGMKKGKKKTQKTCGSCGAAARFSPKPGFCVLPY